MPHSLRDYVMRVNGIFQGEHLEFDNGMNTLLPLSSIEPEHEWDSNQLRSSYFVIADHCIKCMWWVVEMTSEHSTDVAVYLGGGADGRKRLIAPSFCAFLEMYIADDYALYGNFGR